MKTTLLSVRPKITAALAAAFTALVVLPAALHADPPSWWTTFKVFRTEQGQTAPAVNFGAANQGQLKNIAVGAYEYFLSAIPQELGGLGSLTAPPDGQQPEGPNNRAGTGWRLLTLVKKWVVVDHDFTNGTGKVLRFDSATQDYTITGTGPRQLTATAAASNGFLAVNQGQLKAAAAPFYARLSEIYAPYPYPKPWTDAAGDDKHFALANLGQLKKVFSFDLNRDSDGDGLSDLAELLRHDHYDLRAPTNPFAKDTDGDGVEDASEGTGDGTKKDHPAVGLSVFGFSRP
jgi:hypothetical protein